MSRDDESMGWSGADKSPLVVVRQQQEGNAAVAATRTAGSLILILFMLAAVVLAVLAITMHNIYQSDRSAEVNNGTREGDRQIVIYRNELDAARRVSPIATAPALPADHAQAALDTLRFHNATLRKDNQDRIAAAARQQNRREPRCAGLPGVPNPNCAPARLPRCPGPDPRCP